MKFYYHPLYILTWKHLRERRRRYCHTFWEVTSGVLVFVILLLMRQVIEYSYYDKVMSSGADTFIDEIIFSPNDTITRKFMSNVTNTTRQRNGYILQDSNQIIGFPNEKEVMEYLRTQNSTSTAAVIKFNQKNDSFHKLDYTIDLVRTEKMRPSQINLRILHVENPQQTEEPLSLPLMLLQWNIDSTFMKLESGTDVDHDIEFPTVLTAPKNTTRTVVQKKTHMGIIHQFLIFCTVAAPLPFFLYNSSRLVIERRCGLKEMMKIAGVSSNIIRYSHLIDTALLSTVYAALITFLLKVTETPILPESNSLIIALTIILHFLNVTSLAFATSSLSHSYDHANGLALIVYVLSCVLCNICHNHFNSKVQLYIVCWFLPHAPVHLFWDEVKYLEKIGMGSNFFNMATLQGGHTDRICVPVLVSWLMFVVQLVLIMLIAWYIDLVKPGKHGVAYKWNFLFKKQYWSPKKKVAFHVTVEQTKRVLRDDRYFQKAPLRGPIAIKVSQLTKIYGSHSKNPVMALDNISIEAYEGEVTVILGVHDSGKSTLMSIVAGMRSVTSGHVYVKGFDTSSRIRDVRKTIGLCPQHNLTFDYLTVRENIMFFQLLKGQTRDVRLTADNLISKLHLQQQANYYSYQLSASEERCLQVACALAGGADVLILDEPTGKCDAATRHTLWDVILMLRGDKTVLMTTSSLEEADAIADRIALLNRGKLRCFGTPLFLKDAIGVGINLSLTLTDLSKVDTIKEIVDGTLLEATSEAEDKSLTFTIPCRYRERFPQLFSTLESREQELGIKNMRVGMSMEHMFFRFIYEKDKDDEIDQAMLVQRFDDIKEVTGWRLSVQRMRVLIMRNFCHIWSVRYQFIILHMMVPVLGLIAITVTTNSHSSLRAAGTPGWDTQVNPRKVVILDEGPKRTHNLDKVEKFNPDLTILSSRRVAKDFNNLTSEKPQDEPRKEVIGIEMHSDYSKVFLSSKSQPEASKALNLFSNVYMSLVMPYNYAPIVARASVYPREIKYFIPKETILCVMWAMWVAFIITLPLTPFIGLTIHEYISGVRYTHFVVGCPYLLHWLAKMATHSIIFLTIMPPTVLLCAKFLDYEDTLNQDDFLGAVFAAQIIFLPAFLLKMYVLSFFLSEEHAVSLIYMQSIALGFSAPIIQILLSELTEVNSAYITPMYFLTFLGRLSPVFTVSELIAKFTSTARIRAYCANNEQYCNTMLPKDQNSNMLIYVCCGNKKYAHRYFSGTTILELMTLIFHIFFYSVMLIAVQKRWIQNFFARIANFNYVETTVPVYMDLNVYHGKTTARRMMRCIKQPTQCYGDKPPQDMLLVDNLHKQYTNLCRKSRRVNAVRGISFYVKAGESLVLLGQSNSGKTATLLMIAGSTSVTRGDCFVDGKLLSKERYKYMEKVSFTKNTGGLDEFYTGYQNLKVLCLLHGHRVRRAEAFAVNCMGYMGLQQYMHQPVGVYTTARARRLGLCAALLAAPRAVLLDEPMEALNPFARRCVARAFASLAHSGSVLLVAEHRLDWRTLNSIYTTVAIISNGRISAIGPCNYVRDLLANGHTARIKLKLKSIRTYVYEGSSESSSSEDESSFDQSLSKAPTANKPSASESDANRSGNDVNRNKSDTNPNESPRSLAADLQDSSEEEELSSVPSLRSRLERAQIDISRGNISRVLQPPKTEKSVRKPRSEKSREKFKSYDSATTYSSDKASLDQTSIPSKFHAVSFDQLATGVKKATLRHLIADFLHNFPNSELTDEHLPMLYFHIKSDVQDEMPYSEMFSKLELLKNSYKDIVEDYSLGELTVEDVYCKLAKDDII